jgi:hypothetical protein
MFREIIRKSYRVLREKLSGQVDMQELLKRKNIKMKKTGEYESDDDNRLHDPGEEFEIKPWGPPGKVMVWSYRFEFDNPARKRQFLKAIESYPEQEWDSWVRWMDDISNYQGEITVEAHCRVPPDQTGKFRYQFESFITREIILKEEK